MLRDETGGIITGWLIRVVIFIAVLAFIGYEAIAMAITAVQLDGSARDVARAAATAYADDQLPDAATAAAQQQAAAKGVEHVSLEIDGDDIVVVVTDAAPTVIVHEIGFLEGWTTPTASARQRWR